MNPDAPKKSRRPARLTWARPLLRHGFAVGAVAAAMGLRLAFTAWLGPGLPPFITFYPAVMVAAMVAGLGPGLLATALASVAADYWILPPAGHFTIGSPVDRLALAIFIGMGVFISVIAELYGRSRIKAAEYDRELALRGSREQLRLLGAALEAAANGIAITDRQGTLQWVNPAFTTLTGYSREEAVGRNPRVLKSGVHPPEFYRRMWETIARGEAWHGELINRREDGALYPEEMTITPVRAGDGEITHFVAVKQDITERKQAEEQLRATLKEVGDLRAALDEHAIVALTDPQGRITFVNDKFCAISKYPREELLGQDHRIINSGHHPKEFFRDLWTTLAHGQPWHGDIKNRAKDGSFYWVDTTIMPVLNEAGKPRQYVAIRADITERMQAEEALRASEARFRGMANAMPQLAWIARADGHIFWYNQRWYDYTGTTPGQMLGWGWQSVHDVAELPKVLERWKACIATAETFEMTFPLRGADGSFRLFLTRGFPLKDAAGRVEQWFGTNTDVEALKQAEEKILRVNEELEDRVRQRTAELLAANKELEAFCYSVAHDLRAPLRSIDGFSQAVMEDYGPRLEAEGREHLQLVRAGCQRMGQLIDDLLKLSRVTRAPLRREPVNLTALARRIADELQRLAPARVVHCRIAEGLTAAGDPNLLEAALRNLLENAWKFTGRRAEAVIEVGAEAPPNGQAVPGAPVFFVRDNGTGFDMRYAGKLFGVFQRLHSLAEFPGTGVGLATVQRILLRHGGRIWAEAAPDRGATFYFTLNEKGQIP